MHKDEIKTYYDGDELIDILRDHEDNIITFNNELNELKDNVTANHSIDSKAVNNYVECFTKYYEGKTGSKLIKDFENTIHWKLLQKHKNNVAEVKQWSSCFLSLARQFKEMEEGYPEQRCYSLATHYPEAFDALLAKVQLRDLYMYGYNYFYIAYTVLPKLYKEVNNKTKTRTT
uniref:SJCHGC01911 protein n=1 Tax=Schistosoma japonicum TaxID=6182 RepID=Q5D968_SCHJA|nr:SJCHGC01911 protein [Schistosoma japonicum]